MKIIQCTESILWNDDWPQNFFLPRCDPVDIQALEIHLGGVKFAKKKKLSQQVKLRRDVINFATQVSLWWLNGSGGSR